MIPASRLVSDLEANANTAGNPVLERRMADVAVWYYKTVMMVPPENLKKRCDFQDKAIWCLIELNALLLERLREKTGSKYLFMPSTLRIAS